MTIRKAKIEDANEISNLLIRSITDLCAADHQNDPRHVAGWTENKTPTDIVNWLDNDASLCLSLSQEQIAAVGCYTSDGMIQLLYVAPEAQGQGHSSALLQHMETEMRLAGIQTARLVSSKTAQDFYSAKGWTIEGTPVVCYTTAGQPMQKQLIPSNT